MNQVRLRREAGYSLVELVVVIIILGVLASVAVKSVRLSTETARVEQTKRELDQLAHAVTGNPDLVSGGTRTDYGYIGDVGAMPSNLDALVSNPGSYVTWDGPYIRDDFYASSGASESEFEFDGWGRQYTYTGGNSITSTGSGSSITRQLANSTADLLSNTVAIVVTDLSNTPPGVNFTDSVNIVLDYPNGVGGTTVAWVHPGTDGFAEFSSIPVGQHRLRVVYIPNADTLTRQVYVNPGQLVSVNIRLFREVW